MSSIDFKAIALGNGFGGLSLQVIHRGCWQSKHTHILKCDFLHYQAELCQKLPHFTHLAAESTPLDVLMLEWLAVEANRQMYGVVFPPIASVCRDRTAWMGVAVHKRSTALFLAGHN